ncbi:copper transport protein [Geodermatophilus bullaregiensis]|uniref:copper resistance CopC/CopD family protein n=1 Tax=Geodermatophilus bullaregiensis TaxID=1564160 RepID=UPI0019598B42|nr:copper resistance protein CopC [Geodermatophilus bullaregiensis]MBM7807724.1 copper transport protein [Geodermatophilus bullaregiensis]
MSAPAPRRRPPLLLLVLLAGWLGLGVATAGPAAAHAELVSTDPGEGARLDAAPDAVTLRFTEGVSLGAGYARVLGEDGERADTGAPSVDGDTVTVPLRDDLPDASYVVTYRIVSADSHPISGAYAFVVGDGALADAGSVAADPDVDPLVAAALPAARTLGFAGLAVGLGVPAFLVLCWPAGWASPRMRRLTTAGLAAVAVGAVLTSLLQGPYAAGAGLGSLLDPALVATTGSSAFGLTTLGRGALALLLAALLVPLWRRGSAPTAQESAGPAVLAGGVVLATAAVGHPVAGPLPVFATAVTAVHVAAMVLWLGGLAALLAGLVRPGAQAGELAGALPRWSRLASGSVAALVVTGVVQSVREVGSPTALVSTTYGWVLLAKLALVLLLLAAAGVSRVWVQQHLGVARPRPGGRRRVTAHAFAAPAPGADERADEGTVAAARVRAAAQARGAVEDVGPLRRSVLVEAGVAAVVLALSAVLVGTPPARATLAEPVDVTLPLRSAAGESGSVQLSVDPARPGANTLHLYLFDDAGRLAQPADLRVTLTEPEQEIGPLEVDLEPAGPGHWVADGMSIPGAGTWTVAVSVRLDEFTATTASTDFPVR